MGRQQSYVKFESKEALLKELEIYINRDSKDDQTYVLGVVKAIKGCHPFDEGEYGLVLGGERYGQRNPSNLTEETGIKNAVDIAFIDSVLYCNLAENLFDGNLGDFLDAHFYYLNDKEVKELRKNTQ